MKFVAGKMTLDHFNIRKVKFLIILLAFMVSSIKATECQSQLEIKYEKEIDFLRSELLQIQESVSKSLQRIALLKTFQSHPVNIPLVEGLEDAYQSDELLTFKNEKVDEESSSLYADNNVDVLDISNHFVENIVIESKSEFVKYAYLRTPRYIDRLNHEHSNVIVAVHGDSQLWIYSTIDGKVVLSYDLNKMQNGKSKKSIDIENLWALSTHNDQEHMIISLSFFSGDLYILDLSLKNLTMSSVGNDTTLIQNVQQELVVKHTTEFNIWEILVSVNSTLYKNEISNLRKEGLKLTYMNYFDDIKPGVYIFADNHGYFTIFKKDSKSKKSFNKQNVHKLDFHKRIYSGIDEIKTIETNMHLTAFASDHTIGFMKEYDSQIVKEYLFINETAIISISFDQEHSERLYVYTESGHIYIIWIYDEEEIKYEILAKINSNTELYSKIYTLEQYLLLFSMQAGSFQLFNLTRAKATTRGLDVNMVMPTEYTPNYQSLLSINDSVKIGDNTTFQNLIVSSNIDGYSLLVGVSGVQSYRLIQLGFIINKYSASSLKAEYSLNKGMILAASMLILTIFLIWRYWASCNKRRKEIQMTQSSAYINPIKSLQDKKLDEMSQKLASFENQANTKSDFDDSLEGSLQRQRGLKSGLKRNKSPAVSKKNVRFAEGF